MKYDVYLRLYTTKGVICLPFKGLNEVDTFTSMYDNYNNLIEKLIKLLDINLSQDKIYDIDIALFNRSDYSKIKSLSIKYHDDCFDITSIKENLYNYLSKNKDKIKNFEIEHVVNDSMHAYKNDGLYPTDRELFLSIESFFKKASYKKIRDVYFGLKKEQGGISKKMKQPQNIEYSKGTKLSKFNARDNFLNHLLVLANENDQTCADVMEYIAGCDLETLGKFCHPEGLSIVDGVGDRTPANDNNIDMYALDMLCYKGIDNLKEIVSKFNHSIQRRAR